MIDIQNTKIEGCFVLYPRLHKDNRGYFMESYNAKEFKKHTGIETNFVQDNEVYSTQYSLRGLHFQESNKAQSKLVRVTRGEVLDVVVDLRPSSVSYLNFFSIILSSELKNQLFVPKGLAHGYLTLSTTAMFQYKCDAYYDPNSESGIRYDDPNLKIDWGIKDMGKLNISQKDLALPYLEQAVKYCEF